jgi:hypothetical protein
MSILFNRGIHAQPIHLQEPLHERLAQRREQGRGLGSRPSRGSNEAPGRCASGGNDKADSGFLEREGIGTQNAQKEKISLMFLALPWRSG